MRGDGGDSGDGARGAVGGGGMLHGGLLQVGGKWEWAYSGSPATAEDREGLCKCELAVVTPLKPVIFKK